MTLGYSKDELRGVKVNLLCRKSMIEKGKCYEFVTWVYQYMYLEVENTFLETGNKHPLS